MQDTSTALTTKHKKVSELMVWLIKQIWKKLCKTRVHKLSYHYKDNKTTYRQGITSNTASLMLASMLKVHETSLNQQSFISALIFKRYKPSHMTASNETQSNPTSISHMTTSNETQSDPTSISHMIQCSAQTFRNIQKKATNTWFDGKSILPTVSSVLNTTPVSGLIQAM